MALPANVKALNLGCGVRVAPGWINIDNSPGARLARFPRLRWFLWKTRIISDVQYRAEWPRAILIRDLNKPLPFADDSIDFVYSSHFLEHNSLEHGLWLIREIHRVLKSGGLVRIVVPDLELGARRYLKALNGSAEAPSAAADFLDWLQLGRNGVRDPHLWMYDAASLKKTLTEAGFEGVTVCEYQKGRVADCDLLDSRPEDSLHVEAEKL